MDIYTQVRACVHTRTQLKTIIKPSKAEGALSAAAAEGEGERRVGTAGDTGLCALCALDSL